MGKSNIFMDDLTFERELDKKAEQGALAVAVFTAREVHQMCKTCQSHTRDIETLKTVYPSKRDSLISGAGGGAAITGVFQLIYFIGKWLNIWS